MTGRFLHLDEVGEILDISPSQTYALVRTGELPAIQIGGRGQWRVETIEVEVFLQRAYDETKVFVDANPVHTPPGPDQAPPDPPCPVPVLHEISAAR